MSENSFDFWQDHSLRYLEMAFRSDRRETVADPDGLGSRTGDCGDTVTFFLTTRQARIESISFETNGCLNTNACANTVCEIVEGKTLEEAWTLTPEDVAGYLETLPRDHTHCAELAVGALYLALSDCRRRAGEAA
ncbi:MAG: iron-sulfur cluster assembly scaffold protein [Deltaproteobacteria bacterium]|nr:iron-sulfur cluster assembly scaffold protein [Deltaproteobacteria bacterium]